MLWHLLLTVALWPWPLPFTAENLGTMSQWTATWDGAPGLQAGRVLEGSVGRRLVTSFVVPLPCGSIWNTCQAVQWPQHASLLHEAWQAGMRRLRVEQCIHEPNLLLEIQRHAQVAEWPLFLLVRMPRGAPLAWDVLVSNRLTCTLGPQLDASGFFVRPLCLDRPFVFLLWPQECIWSRHARSDLVLPLRKRVGKALFHMLLEAHRTLWPPTAENAWEAPDLRDLIPQLTLTRDPVVFLASGPTE